jgi:hypothetical protein
MCLAPNVVDSSSMSIVDHLQNRSFNGERDAMSCSNHASQEEHCDMKAALLKQWLARIGHA